MARELKLLTYMPPQFAGLVRACEEANTPLARNYLDRYDEVLNHVGGGESVTVTKRSEARDFAALDILIEVMLSDAFAGKQVDIGGLTQAMNTKSGKARVLGLEARPKRVNTRRELMKASVTQINSAVAS